ncbi:unnamed protein product [Mytilus coruscus]|uniref:Uncharacterized protein n=1 Tax=Mytilus coruscus TaxID=42192 RepID=A0A6J8EPD2_MYTCO|nr:unnamed protein product [Mytilus coruscus]
MTEPNTTNKKNINTASTTQFDCPPSLPLSLGDMDKMTNRDTEKMFSRTEKRMNELSAPENICTSNQDVYVHRHVDSLTSNIQGNEEQTLPENDTNNVVDNPEFLAVRPVIVKLNNVNQNFHEFSTRKYPFVTCLEGIWYIIAYGEVTTGFRKTCEHDFCIFKQDTRKTSIVVGSIAESFLGFTWKQSDIMFLSDTDWIEFDNTYKVHEHIEELERDKKLYPTLTHVLHTPDNTNPGFTRLAFPQKNLMEDHHIQGNIFLKNNFKEEMYQINRKMFPAHNISIHGPAVTAENLSGDMMEHFAAGGTLPLDFSSLKKTGHRNFVPNLKDIDCVSCLRGEKWPAEATEWATRQRLFNWPTTQLIQKVIKSGYILAGVGSKESKHSEFQWRISFNNAEQFLIESFNETQIHCSWLLKSLKTQLSSEAGKNITSYTMKTVMFWCMEETLNEYWQSSNLVCCFCFCISKLKLFLEKRFLPNYFIKKRNLFILSEFTSTMQTKTICYLERLLDNPKGSIISFLPKCDINNEIPISCILERQANEVFIIEWIIARVSMTYLYSGICTFWEHEGKYNIENSFQRCEDASKQLSTINYTQPLVKTLINSMAVLQYALFKKEREIVGQTSDLDKRNKCLEYMKLSFKGNKTNTRLRIATCYLDNGVKGKYQILKIIRKVTDKKYFYNDYLRNDYKLIVQTLEEVLTTFENMPRDCKNNEIKVYNSVIDEDLTNQDPYKTFKQFKQLKTDGFEIGSYKLFKCVWDACCFDVPFMPAEVSILPKPAALELCIDPSKNRVIFNPILYGLLLEYLWHVQNYSDNKDREKVIKKMIKCIQFIPEGQQTIGLNFITYCCALQQDYYSASRYLIRSFKLNPVETNVAYLYIKYIINLLVRTMSGGSF